MPTKNYSVKLSLFFLLYSCVVSESKPFQHCLFDDVPIVKGRVKSIVDSIKYSVTADSLADPESVVVRRTSFDEHGKSYGSSGTWNFKDTADLDYSFNMMGTFSRDELINRENDSLYRVDSTTYVHYPEYNLEDDYMLFKNGGRFLRYEFRYNEDCEVLEFKKMNPEGKLERKYTFQYDKEHNLIECLIYHDVDSLFKQVKYNYDKNNNRTAYSVYDAKKQLTSSVSFTYNNYDTTGNWQRSDKFKNNKLLAVTKRSIEYY